MVVSIAVALPVIAESRDVQKDNADTLPLGGQLLRNPSDFDLLDPRYRRLFDILYAKVPAGILPSRKQFDPLDVPELLGFINLVEVYRGRSLRFRFRLHGTVQTQAAGRDVTGLFVEDAVVPTFVDRINGNMTAVVDSRLPVYDRFQMPHPNRGYIDSERVYYPLAEDGRIVDMILILNGYY